MKMKMMEVDLTEAQIAELDAAKGNPEVVETILSRIADEALTKQFGDDKPDVAAVELTEPRLDMDDFKPRLLDALNTLRDSIKLKLFEDAIRGVHDLLHTHQPQRATALLCPLVALIEGDRVPGDVLSALAKELNTLNLERAKNSCEGEA